MSSGKASYNEQMAASLESISSETITLAEAEAEYQAAKIALDESTLETQIETAQEELAALTGIDDSIMSLADALEKYNFLLNETLTEFTKRFDNGEGYAAGGIASGSSSGYLATLHGTEAIIPLNGGSIPVQVTRDGSAKEIKNLTEKVHQIGVEQIKLSKKTLKILQKFDVVGMPEERAA